MKQTLLGLICLGLSVTARGDLKLCSKIGDLKHCQSGEWKLVQSALDDGKTILRYRFYNGNELNFFISAQSQDLKSMVAEGAKIKEEGAERLGSLDWSTIQVEKNGTTAVIFQTSYRGNSYYGYASAQDQNEAYNLMAGFLNGLNTEVERSLTGPDFKGKKYYFGWGAAALGDPNMMHNEVKFDVLHTHDIFTAEIGGSYMGTKYTDYNTATSTNIKNTWNDLKAKITADDMYVQYSSGHGSPSGLAVGASYDQMRDTALGFKAKETIIFTMACYSGNLVESFNKKKSEWQNFQADGKTLFVMGSSKPSETSSTGPGTDPEQPNSPNGSAGSAFGHALWKSLIGHADGEKSGVKDGYLNIEEIRDYTVKTTIKVGDHTPVFTGSYDAKLIMNRVPKKAQIDALGVSSEGLTFEEVTAKVQELDKALRIQ